MRLLHGLIAFTALLGLVAGEVQQATLPPEDSIVSHWPTNMALRIGQEGRMNFTLKPGKGFTLLSMKALFVGGAAPETIYQATTSSAVIQPNFIDKVEKIESSQHDLKIKSMTWTGAGTYLAGVTHTDLKQEESQFEVVAIDEAKCGLSKEEDIKEGDLINMDCSAQYTGSKVPQMKWTDDQGQDLPGFVVPVDVGGDDKDKTTPSPTAPKTVTYRANITASRTHDRHQFRCSLSFDDPITYTDNCSKSFGVQFAVSTMTFTPDPTPKVGRYKVGDTINCTAIGNPDPSFRWRGNTVNGPQLQAGATLLLKGDMVGGVNNFTCIAKNRVEQEVEIFRNLSFTVTHLMPSGGNQVLISMGLMWALTLILMLLIKLF